MHITTSNRGYVEQKLRAAAAASPAVANACADAGAKLDGSDDLLTLCAVDDALALGLPTDAHPLGVTEVPVHPALRIRKGHGLTVRESRPTLNSFRRDHARPVLAVDQLIEACAPSIEERAALAGRLERLLDTASQVAAMEAFAMELGNVATSVGAPGGTGPSPYGPDDPGRVVERLRRIPTVEHDGLRQRLLEVLRAAKTQPIVQMTRPPEASLLVGRGPPWMRAPATVREAAEWWHREFGAIAELLDLEEQYARRIRELKAAIIDSAEQILVVHENANAHRSKTVQALAARARPAILTTLLVLGGADPDAPDLREKALTSGYWSNHLPPIRAVSAERYRTASEVLQRMLQESAPRATKRKAKKAKAKHTGIAKRPLVRGGLDAAQRLVGPRKRRRSRP